MAEKWNVAFGRYLRMLRERRGLSLENVASLSQAFPETLDKPYVSKAESGMHRLSLRKVIPFCRIYHVSADVLIERLELDLELDRIGGPPTADLTFAELTEAGREAKQHGRSWDGYAYLRDALPKARTAPLEPRFRDHAEQYAVATINLATAAHSLGRSAFPFYDLQYLHSTCDLSPRFRSLLLERLAVLSRHIGSLDEARRLGDESICQAAADEEHMFLGYAYESRANQAYHDRDLRTSLDLHEKAFRAFRGSDQEAACANCLHNLARTYFELKRYASAKRCLIAGQRFVNRYGQESLRGRNYLLLGEVNARQGRRSSAKSNFTKAAQIARVLKDKTLRFKAEYHLFTLAKDAGNAAAARSILRRLLMLANYVPRDTQELKDLESSAASLSAFRASNK